MEKQESIQDADLSTEKMNDVADASGVPSSLPFVTTSDVLNQLNKNLKELSLPGEESLEPRFELQKRLPDGSTIPASKSDLSASDLQNKLEVAYMQITSSKAKRDSYRRKRTGPFLKSLPNGRHMIPSRTKIGEFASYNYPRF